MYFRHNLCHRSRPCMCTWPWVLRPLNTCRTCTDSKCQSMGPLFICLFFKINSKWNLIVYWLNHSNQIKANQLYLCHSCRWVLRCTSKYAWSCPLGRWRKCHYFCTDSWSSLFLARTIDPCTSHLEDTRMWTRFDCACPRDTRRHVCTDSGRRRSFVAATACCTIPTHWALRTCHTANTLVSFQFCCFFFLVLKKFKYHLWLETCI